MIRFRAFLRASIVLGAGAWAAGCGDDTTGPPPPEPSQPAAITVSPATAELAALDATVQLSAQVRDQHGQPMAGAAVTWVSGNTGVATVDGTGLVTAKGNGTATINATAGTASGSAAMTVVQRVVAVDVLPAIDSVSVGDTVRLSAEATDGNGYAVAGAEFNWASSDDSVATVDAAGLVRGVGEGAVAITAMAGSVQATMEFLVFHPDRPALVALYEATSGAGWIANDGWLSERPIKEWHGVTIGSSGRVTGLTLSASNLVGSVPPELGDLSSLEILDLERNQLSGPIPRELARLRGLRTLILGVNDLNGQIPAELGNLVNLEVLRLRRNDLTGPIPAELSKLHNLIRLGLDRNSLTGRLPLSFLRLDQLRLLHFADNETLCVSGSAGFALWLAQLDLYVGPLCNEGDKEALVSLYEATGGRNWTRADGWLGDGVLDEWHGVDTDSLGRVTALDLSGNGLKGSVLESLAQLTGVMSLRIGGNVGLTGPLPVSLSTLSLQEFRYHDTELCIPLNRAFGEWLASIPSHEGTDATCAPLSDREVLKHLYEVTGGTAWTNDARWLSGRPLGEWHGVTTNEDGRVVRLSLQQNNLAGPIPSELANLSELWDLNLSWNRLTSPIPAELAGLSRLARLILGRNDLAGPIPAGLGNLSRLAVLYLDGNGLTGQIPAELGNLSNLVLLDIGENELSGPIPPELSELSELAYLYLDTNRLTGPIPAGLGSLSSLRELNLAWNRLTGPIPAELGSLSGLVQLVLGQNDLTGPIPAALGRVSSLAALHLDGNDLMGPIPPELGSLSSLFIVNLSENGLTGPIPPDLGNLSGLSTMNLSGNDLAGPIPTEIGNLSNLTRLELFGNGLSGRIPPELAGLSSLVRLRLDGNELSGPIPAELVNLSRLRFLWLMENQLSGTLPPELGGMTSLRRLNLANNSAMYGALPASLTALPPLTELIVTGTDLCASADAGFQSWLSGVKHARVGPCGADTGSRAYLTQAVQSLAFPVPLVADKAALLRVFVTASRATSARIPRVRATFHVDGEKVYMADIPGSETPIPIEVQEAESDLRKSANRWIPASVIQPGLEMVIEIDPDGVLPPGTGITKRIPENGRASVLVETVPAMDLTVVPFLFAPAPDSTIVEIALGMAAEQQTHEMLWDSHTLLPISDFDVKAHEPVLTSTNDVVDLLLETALIRHLERGNGYYMGIMEVRVVGGESGVAYTPGKVGFSAAEPLTLAHELGHNLNLLHAPCGGAGGPDPAFPQANGSIGVWGYDPRDGGALVPPHVRDMMSSCGPPYWVSDYGFTRALAHRLANPANAPGVAHALTDAPTRTILLWGGADEQDNPFLEPAFLVDAPPSVPRSPGEYELAGRTASGDELFSLSFDMMEMADADGRASFVFALPVRTEWTDALESITLSGPEGSTTMDLATDQPLAILRDPDSRQVRGILRDTSAVKLTQTAAQVVGLTEGVEVLFSRGMPDAAAWRRYQRYRPRFRRRDHRRADSLPRMDR